MILASPSETSEDSTVADKTGELARIYCFKTGKEVAGWGAEPTSMRQATDSVEPVVGQALHERLAAFPHYAALPAESLARLVDSAVPRLIRQDEAALRQGEGSPSLFIVLTGRFKMTRSLSNGRSVLLALFNPGDLFGVKAGLGSGSSESTVEALENSLCLEVSRERLLAAMVEWPQLLGELLPILTRRVAECGNCAIEGTFYRVEPRFARLFLRLAESVGQLRDGAMFIPVSLSRQDLADMAGTTIETSIRILSRWGKEGVVVTLPDGFLIGDREPLARLCGD